MNLKPLTVAQKARRVAGKRFGAWGRRVVMAVEMKLTVRFRAPGVRKFIYLADLPSARRAEKYSDVNPRKSAGLLLNHTRQEAVPGEFSFTSIRTHRALRPGVMPDHDCQFHG